MPQNDDFDPVLMGLTLGILLGGLLCIALSGCSFVRIKDGEWCARAYDGAGNCYHTLTQESRDMTAKEFDLWLNDPVDPKICGSIDAFTAQKGAVEELCAQAKNCIYLVPDASPSPTR